MPALIAESKCDLVARVAAEEMVVVVVVVVVVPHSAQK